MGANAGRGLSPIIDEIRVLKCDIAVMGCRKGTLGHDDTTATRASDAVAFTKNLKISRRSSFAEIGVDL
jgi:hypothetical protein